MPDKMFPLGLVENKFFFQIHDIFIHVIACNYVHTQIYVLSMFCNRPGARSSVVLLFVL